jgi:site-specific DNA-methyltransferase (adenine-specific)
LGLYLRTLVNASEPRLDRREKASVLESLIRTYTQDGETVLDNTMGSGTTGVACVRTNRNLIGIEVDQTYFEIARNWSNDEKASRKPPLLDKAA